MNLNSISRFDCEIANEEVIRFRRRNLTRSPIKQSEASSGEAVNKYVRAVDKAQCFVFIQIQWIHYIHPDTKDVAE